MVTLEEFDNATAQARQLQKRLPGAVSARYDRHMRRVIVQLHFNLGIFCAPRDAEGLENATPEQLDTIEISPSGFGLHSPKLDADIYLPSLLERVFGSERWMAASMGMPGGRSRSVAKTNAARENGKKAVAPAKNSRQKTGL